MPKGVPAKGFRMTKKRLAGISGVAYRRTSDSTTYHLGATFAKKQEEEDVGSVAARINERFSIMERLMNSAIYGNSRAVIVSGPAGVGKSFKIEEMLEEWNPDGDQYTITRGYVRPTGLYRLLYQHREENQVIVFDDSDSVFYDDVSLNLLKAVCDTTEKRHVSWLSETKMEDDEGEPLPRKFEFRGTIIFITNLDFDAYVEQHHKLTPHLQALMSRAHYIDLSIKSPLARYVRIEQVAKQGLFRKFGFKHGEDREVLDYMKANTEKLREVSLRCAIKIATLCQADPKNWKATADITCLRNRF